MKMVVWMVVLVETAEVERKVDQVEVLETEPTPMVVMLALVVQMLTQVVGDLSEVILDLVEVVLVKLGLWRQATHLLEMVEME